MARPKVEPLEARIVLSSPSVVSVFPAENSPAPADGQEIVIQFDQDIDLATASVFAFSGQTGRLSDAPVLVADDQVAVELASVLLERSLAGAAVVCVLHPEGDQRSGGRLSAHRRGPSGGALSGAPPSLNDAG